jgi:hypothetical protein
MAASQAVPKPPARGRVRHAARFIVRDENEARLHRFVVDRDAEWVPVRQQDRPRTDARERLAPSSMRFTSVHEPRLDAERHVVEEELLLAGGGLDADGCAAAASSSAVGEPCPDGE